MSDPNDELDCFLDGYAEEFFPEAYDDPDYFHKVRYRLIADAAEKVQSLLDIDDAICADQK